MPTRRRRSRLVAAVMLGALAVGCQGREADGDRGALTPSSPNATTPVSPVEVRVHVLSDDARDAVAGSGVDLVGLIEREVARAASRLPPRDRGVSVTVKDDPTNTVVVPSLGVGAWAGGQGIVVSVDPDHPRLAVGVETLPLLLAHEIHHVWRFSAGVEGPRGLIGHAVSEGLADHFAREVHPDRDPPGWTEVFPEHQTEMWWQRLVADHDPDRADAGYHAWFRGGDDAKPPGAGYTIGYRLVGDYLERNDTTAAASVAIPWETVVAEAGEPWTRE